MTTLKGIFPNPKPTRRKNFILENVKNLRRTEEFFHTKEVEEFRKLRPQNKSLDKYRNVASRINSTLRGAEKKEDSLEKESIRRLDKNLSNVRINGGCAECKVNAPMRSKNPETNARIGQGSTKQNSRDTSIDVAMRRRNNINKSGELSHFDGKISGEAKADCKIGKKDLVMYKNQEIQTLDTEDLDSLYKEGVIRYPSGRIISKKNPVIASSDRINNNNSSKDNDKNLDMDNDDAKGKSLNRKCASSPSDRGDGFVPRGSRRGSFDRADSPSQSMTTRDQIDHVKLNKQRSGAITVAEKLVTQFNNGQSANHRKGVVPKYLRDRKEAQRQEQQRTDEKLKEAASHPDCPEGHVPLPNDERKETLRMLKKHHQEYVNELNMMPIKTDTLRSHRRKMEIEKQLNKLEEGIKVFSRPKVYVKVNS